MEVLSEHKTTIRKRGPSPLNSESSQDANHSQHEMLMKPENFSGSNALSINPEISPKSASASSYSTPTKSSQSPRANKLHSWSASNTPFHSPMKSNDHEKFLGTYKVNRCKDKANHDKKVCPFWHSKLDRRRNPLEVRYASTDCANMDENVICKDGDACLHSHSNLEKMFHPDLYKISLCMKFMNAHSCDRGKYCAFAHSSEELRVTSNGPMTPPPKYSHNHPTFPSELNNEHSSHPHEDSSPQSPKSGSGIMLDGVIVSNVVEKLVKLIKKHGSDGIISSELPRRYFDLFGERLELMHESGEKLRIKEILSNQSCISVSMHKGVQPKYVYTEGRSNLHTCADSPTSSDEDLTCSASTSEETHSKGEAPSSLLSKLADMPMTQAKDSEMSFADSSLQHLSISSPNGRPVLHRALDAQDSISVGWPSTGPSPVVTTQTSLLPMGTNIDDLKTNANLWESRQVGSFVSPLNNKDSNVNTYFGAVGSHLSTTASAKSATDNIAELMSIQTLQNPRPENGLNNIHSNFTAAYSQQSFVSPRVDLNMNAICNALRLNVVLLQNELLQRDRDFDIQREELRKLNFQLIETQEIQQRANSVNEKTFNDFQKGKLELESAKHEVQNKASEVISLKETLLECNFAFMKSQEQKKDHSIKMDSLISRLFLAEQELIIAKNQTDEANRGKLELQFQLQMMKSREFLML